MYGYAQLIEIRRCHETSRDPERNRTQEVDGSIPFSSTIINDFRPTSFGAFMRETSFAIGPAFRTATN